jgi:hypothetical protein
VHSGTRNQKQGSSDPFLITKEKGSKMFILEYLAIGFITVFGWNSGQVVWDKYIEPPSIEQPAEKRERK